MPASISGLADEEARRRLAVDGPNELPTTGRRRPWRIALEILREPMFGLLLAGGVIYAALGDLLGGAVLLVAGFTGSLRLTSLVIVWISAGLVIVNAGLMALGVVLFDRESILTRWK